MFSRHIKRILDVSLSLVAILTLAPVMAIAALAVRLTMGSPVIFWQKRAGMSGKPFNMPKLRTMTDARNDHGQLLSDEERLTRLGAFLRRTSLDELPQLWSVLKGDMSLIGPRPLPVEYLPLYTPEQNRRHQVPVGIVGWAGVQGRNLSSWEKRFELDLWYVDNWTLLLDVKILGMAVLTVIGCAGVSEEGRTTSSKFMGTRQPEKTE